MASFGRPLLHLFFVLELSTYDCLHGDLVKDRLPVPVGPELFYEEVCENKPENLLDLQKGKT